MTDLSPKRGVTALHEAARIRLQDIRAVRTD